VLKIVAKPRAPEHSQANSRCPFCLDDLCSDDHADCDRCGTGHHASCFEAHGRCTMLGCDGRPKVEEKILGSDEQAALVAKTAGLRGLARLRAIERLPSQGVAVELLASFASSPEEALRAVALATMSRHGDSGAGAELVALAGNKGLPVPVRGEALRGLALQPAALPGAAEVALEALDQPELRERATWLLRGSGPDDWSRLLDRVEGGESTGEQVTAALVQVYRGLEGEARSQRLGDLSAFRMRAVDWRGALIEAAIAEDELLRIPRCPVAPALRPALLDLLQILGLGSLLTVTALAIGTATAGEGPGLILVLGWSLGALTGLLGLGGLLRLSGRQQQFLRAQERHQLRRELAEERRKEARAGAESGLAKAGLAS